MKRWEAVAIATAGAVILNISAFAQTSTPPASTGTGASTGTSTTPGSQTATTKAKPMGKDSMAGSGMTSERVRAVQEALKSKGHDPGPIDGILGPHTKAALTSFQKAEKLPESGRGDAQTLTKLGVQ